MSTRICSCCKVEKDLSEFNKRKHTASGVNGKCKICTRAYLKEYLAPIRKPDPKLLWKLGHKPCRICKIELPLDKFHKRGTNGLKGNCKVCEQKRNTEYRRKANWDSIYKKKCRATDLNIYLKDNLRGRLNDSLRRHTSGGMVNKRHSALTLVGCSIQELIKHLESKFAGEMSWNNRGKVWEIDHKLPCASFDLTDIDQQKLCFHFTNLQPLTVHDNRSKSDKIF